MPILHHYFTYVNVWMPFLGVENNSDGSEWNAVLHYSKKCNFLRLIYFTSVN